MRWSHFWWRRVRERWGGVADPERESYGPKTEKWEKLTGEESWLFQEFFPKRSVDLLGDLKRHGFLETSPE
jgi:hypothetical protein